VKVISNYPVKDVSAGKHHTVVLLQDGSLWATGLNKNGQLGDRDDNFDRDTFAIVAPAKGTHTHYTDKHFAITAVSAGDYHTLALDEDGMVWGTGSNAHGQLGMVHPNVKNYYVQVDEFAHHYISFRDTTAVSAGHAHSMLIKKDGSLWASGLNSDGQLGDGKGGPSKDGKKGLREKFGQVIASGVKAVSAGFRHTVVLKTDGSVWASGANEFGALGDGTTNDQTSFVKVFDGPVKEVIAGKDTTILKTSDGKLCVAGFNNEGHLGTGDKVTVNKGFSCS